MRQFRLLGRAQREERGQILVLAAVGLVLAMVAAALAIDLGSVAEVARRNQKVADLAALDAVRVLPGLADQAADGSVTKAAVDSAARNGFPTTGLVVEWSASKNGPWSVDPATLGTASVVRVSATSPHTNQFPFVSNGESVTRRAIAGNQPEAEFSVGSTLASVDTQKSFLDPVLGSMLGGAAALNLSAVSYSGLVAGNVSLEALQTQLLSAYPAVGTPTGLLNTPIKVADLFTATATVLHNQPNALAEAEVNHIPISLIPNLKTVTLGKLISLSQPGNDSALATTLNVFNIVTGSAEVANGTNFVSVPGMTANVPGVATVSTSLYAIQPAQSARGPVGTEAQNSQVKVRLHVDLLPITVVLTSVTVKLDIDFSAGSAKGVLTAIQCATAPASISISPTTSGAGIGLAGTILPPVGGTLTATGTVAATAPPASPLNYLYPTQFQPPVGPAPFSRHVGAATLKLSPSSPLSVSGSGGVLAPAVALVVQPLLPTIFTTVDAVISPLLQPVLQVLGLDLASADISAIDIFPTPPSCGGPTLVK